MIFQSNFSNRSFWAWLSLFKCLFTSTNGRVTIYNIKEYLNKVRQNVIVNPHLSHLSIGVYYAIRDSVKWQQFPAQNINNKSNDYPTQSICQTWFCVRRVMIKSIKSYCDHCDLVTGNNKVGGFTGPIMKRCLQSSFFSKYYFNRMV